MQKETENTHMPNNIILENRTKLAVSGVREVVSFEESLIVTVTTNGELSIRGEGLCINDFDVKTGELSVCGRVIAMFYNEKEQNGRRHGFFSRVFK